MKNTLHSNAQTGFRLKSHHWLAAAMIVFIVLSWSGQYAKYQSLGYNGLDLAIYDQVFSESAHGRLFNFTIHPHSYLGDHVELLVIGLLPVYWLFQSPLTLLFLQSLALGLSAWPLFLFCRRRLNRGWSLGISLAYLISPFVWSTNFYEFHLLPLAIPLLLAAWLAYDRRQFIWFLIWLGLALMAREDVALVVFGFGLLAWLDRRPWRWRLIPMLVSGLWFIAALKIAALSGNLGSYKFLKYYAWLGPDLTSIIANFFGHPWLVIQRLFRLENILFVVGLGLPFFYLPLRALRWLLPTLPIFLQLGLAGSTGDLALQIHYTSLFLPFLFAASAVGLASLIAGRSRLGFLRFFGRETGLLIGVLTTVAIASFLIIGPLPGIAARVIPKSIESEPRQLASDFLDQIPSTAPVAAGYRLISQVAQRPVVASLHYVYLGTEQYSDQPYQLPESIETLLIDQSDWLIYHVVYRENQKTFLSSDDRFRSIIKDRGLSLKLALDDLLLYAKDSPADAWTPVNRSVQLPVEHQGAEIKLNNGLKNLGWVGLGKDNTLILQSMQLNGHQYPILPITFYWQQTAPVESHSEITLRLTGSDGQVYQKLYPLAPLEPQSEWSADEIVATRHRFLIPRTFMNAPFEAALEVSESAGRLGLDGWRSIEPQYQARTVAGTINLGVIDPRALSGN